MKKLIYSFALLMSTAFSMVHAIGNPIVNGSFESGDYTGWTLFETPSTGRETFGTWGIATDGQTIVGGEFTFDYFDGINVSQISPGLPHTYTATEGNNVAYQLQNGSQTHTMYQDVEVCSQATNLTWDMEYRNHTSFNASSQYSAVEIWDPVTNTILSTLFKTVVGDPAVMSMTAMTANISAFAGQTVRIMVTHQVQNYFFDAAWDNFRIPSCETRDILQVGPHSTSWNDGSFNVTQIPASDFPLETLTDYDAIYVDASARNLSIFTARSAEIATYVNNGGGIVTDSGGDFNAPNFSWTPHGGTLGWVTQHQNSVTITSLGLAHPVTAGLTNAGLSGWGNSQHNYFSATAGLDILTVNPSNQASTLAGTFGAGRVVYFGLDPTFHQPNGQSQQLIRQALNWAGNVSIVDEDTDADGVLDISDNCVNTANTDQADNDNDGAGDVCDPDDDNDTVLDTADNCPTSLAIGGGSGDPDQTDTDGDGAGDICDTDLDGDGVLNNPDICPVNPDPLQEDNDLDGQGDACDDDDDNDGVLDATPDNCPFDANAGQEDLDGDGIGDICDKDVDGDGVNDVDSDGVVLDNCPITPNPLQDDNDLDDEGDACDPDDDNDGVVDGTDNCPLEPNPVQLNNDGDGLGDACDPDDDNDGVVDGTDNCPFDANANQADAEGDGIGDVCDPDDDNDGVADGTDNCPVVANSGQADLDGDGEGDACDIDKDGDDVDNDVDNCMYDPNSDQADLDGDALGDVCDPDIDGDGVLNAAPDNCPRTVNPDQADNEGDGIGDLCDDDDDNDGVDDLADNCPITANQDQTDFDLDGFGDACDPDDDNDGVADVDDQCSETPALVIVDEASGCSIAQLCPCEGPYGTSSSWRNHGKFVSCTAKTSESFVDLGLITDAEKDAIVSGAAQSTCGDKK